MATCPRQHTVHSFLHHMFPMWLQALHRSGATEWPGWDPNPRIRILDLMPQMGQSPQGNIKSLLNHEDPPGESRPQPVSRCAGCWSCRKEGDWIPLDSIPGSGNSFLTILDASSVYPQRRISNSCPENIFHSHLVVPAPHPEGKQERTVETIKHPMRNVPQPPTHSRV